MLRISFNVADRTVRTPALTYDNVLKPPREAPDGHKRWRCSVNTAYGQADPYNHTES